MLELEARADEGRTAKPRELITLLGLDPAYTRVLKRETRLRAPVVAELPPPTEEKAEIQPEG